MSPPLEWAGIAAGPLGALLGVCGKALFDRSIRQTKYRAEETKLDAQAVRIIAETAVTLVAPLKREIEELSQRMDELDREHTAATGKLRRALTYIRDLLVWISLHVSDEFQPPQAPFGLDLT